MLVETAVDATAIVGELCVGAVIDVLAVAAGTVVAGVLGAFAGAACPVQDTSSSVTRIGLTSRWNEICMTSSLYNRGVSCG